MAARGPDWTDLLGDLLPIVITVVIGILALTRRVVESIFKRQAESANAKPRPPLKEEVRRFLDMLDKDTGRGERVPEPEPTELPIDLPRAAPLPAAPLPVAADSLSVAPPMVVAPALDRALSAHAERQNSSRRVDLRQAVVWSEILSPPVAERSPREI